MLDGDAEGVNVSALKGLQANVTAYVDIDGVTVGAEAEVGYSFGGNKLSVGLDIWYNYDVTSAGYGEAVLTLKQINGAPVFVQVGCDIAELLQAIQTVMTFGGAESGASFDGVAAMVNSAFSCDFSSLLTDVYADNLQIKLGVNVDTVLDMLGVNAGVKFGNCALAYTRGDGVYGGELFAALPAIGFSISVSGEEGVIEKPDTSNCLDLVYLLEDITAFAQSELYEINIVYDGIVKAEVTAYANIKGLAVYAEIKVSYEYNDLPVSAELKAWYENNEVVLELDKLNGSEVNVVISAEISKTVEAVKELLTYCNVQLEMPSVGGDVNLEEVLTSVLTADLKTLIPELATTTDGLKLGVNADEVLKLFNVDIPLTIGTVNLAYSHSNCNLIANIPALGLDVTISGLNGETPQPNRENCLDLVYLIEDITAFAQSDLYEINIVYDGIVKADVTAYANIKGLAVYAEVKFSYEYNGLPVSAELKAWYENNEVVLALNKLNGSEVNVVISAEISKTVEAIKELLAYCNVQFEMPEVGGDVNLEEVLSSVLTADLKTLIHELATTTDGLKLGVNADEVLKLFNVDIPLTIGTVNLAYSHSNCNLVANIPSLGLGVTISGLNGEIPQPNRSNCLDLVYLIEDITSFAKADLYELNIVYDGIVKADVTAYANLKGLAVYAEVKVSYEYNGLPVSAELKAWYENNEVVLELDKLNGSEVNVVISAEISKTVEAVKELLAYCNVQFEMPEVGGDVDLEEVLTSVLTADLKTLIPELATTTDGLKLGVNADEVLKLFNVDIPLTIGTVNLAYSHSNCNLVANIPALGLGVTISGLNGEIPQPNRSNCLDLVYLVEDITAFAQSDLYEINIVYDGIVKAEVTAYANLKGLAVYAEVKVSYEYNGLPISAELKAWYENNEVVLELDKLNGSEVNVVISAEIDKTIEAVKELLAYCNVQFEMPSVGGDVNLEEVLTSVLAADLKTLIPELATTTDGLKLGVNADEVLKLFNVDIPLTIGTVNLAYLHSNCNLVANIPALGLGVTISGLNGEIPQPDRQNCLDLAELVALVNSAAAQVKDIINNEAVSFEIVQGQTYLNLDGITVGLWGGVEVSWKNGGEYVALDLAMAIEENGSDVTHLKLLYNKNAQGQPLVRLALNGVGIDIYQEDIQTVTDGFNRIYEKIASALGLSQKASENTVEETDSEFDFSAIKSNDKLMALLFGIFADGGWIDVLNDMTLTVESQVVENGEVQSVKRSLTLTYAAENAAEVRVSTDGNIALYYDASFGSRFTFGGEVRACAANGALVQSLGAQFKEVNMSSSQEEGSAGFVKLAYDYLFEALASVSVKNILGADTYAVKFVLDGNNCNIEALENVKIDASLYFTGASNDYGKLAEANLTLDVKGVVVDLNVISERVGNQTYFYINLKQVVNFRLPDLKVMATQSSLYDTISVLISTINDTNVLDVIGGLFNTDSEEAEKIETKPEVGEKLSDQTVDKIAETIEKLINFDFGEAVVATEENGVTTAVLDLDNVVRQLGVKSKPLGTVEFIINHDYHSMKTSGKALVTDAAGACELKEWISLSSEKTAVRDYSKLNKEDYISIEFLPDLIGDLVKFATDGDGKLYNKFTFSGSISAKIVNLFTLNIDKCNVTVGIDAEKGLTASVVAHVNKVSALGLVTIPESTFGLTYQNGLITLARGLNTSAPEYKIMTLDFFVDHMLIESNSSLQWLLDISGWKTMLGIIKSAAGDLNVSSGLTTTENVYLYANNSASDEREISMYDYVEAINVIINGNRTASFGNPAALEKALGVHDNYYGFSLNAKAISGGTLTELYAALVRGDNGISGLKAYGAIESYVTFSVNLDYAEGCGEEYAIGNSLKANLTAPSFYESAKAIADEAEQVIDTEYFVKKPEAGYDEKFGCFTVTASGEGYTFTTENSNILYSHVLTVVGLNGEIERRDVRHGSTVYLYDNYSPVYTDASKAFRLIYSTSPEQVGATQVIMNGDLTVYALSIKAVNVIVHNGEEIITICSFTGDKVPVTVEGLQTINTPTYENGETVGENDIIPEGVTSLDIYGVFVNTEVVVNYVKYTFSAQTMTYTASGKAAGFNDYYSVKGNTLVLENAIGGYPVTAIADGAFANTEGKPLTAVIVPENIVTVGESAFADNVDIQYAVFLAENVTFLGKDGKSQTMPFYGCSVSGNEEKTALAVYYNNITANGGNWKHFRYVSKVISFNFYVGDNGGALYSNGNWQIADYKVTVDLNGVSGSTLTQEAIEDILAPYFPYVTAGAYEGSAYEATVNKALEAWLANMSFTRDGITYMCDYSVTVATENGKTTLTYSVTYKKTAEIYVSSELAFSMFGTDIAANTLTPMNVPMDGDDINLPTPVHATHKFVAWSSEKKDGKLIYTASWNEKQKFNLTVNIKKGLTDNNNIYLNGVNQGKNVSPVIKVYEGSVSISVDSNTNRIYITDSANTYYIEVKELSLKGFKYVESGKLRGITTGDIGDKTVNDNTSITVNY